MPSDKFPGPNYNRIIETDPQIVKINLDQIEWGSRPTAQPKRGDPQRPGSIGNAPNAPEMGIKHVSGKS